MPRTPLIAGNWKLNLTLAEGRDLVSGIVRFLAATPTRADVLVCPTALGIAQAVQLCAGSPLRVGGQHCHTDEKGAFTGEISATYLKDAGATAVIIGHSERRQFFAETDALVQRRLKAALAQGLLPIVCVGETLPERDAGKLQDVLRTQVTGALGSLNAEALANLVIAYEPVWAIGTGRTATAAQAQEAHAFIRSLLRTTHGTLADRTRILYGGSVKPDNARELLVMPDIDGALVGGASLKLADFTAIIAAAPAAARSAG